MILVIQLATTRRRLVGQLAVVTAAASKLILTSGKLLTGMTAILATPTRAVTKLAVTNPVTPSSHHLVAKLIVILVVNPVRLPIPGVLMQVQPQVAVTISGFASKVK